MYTTDQILSWCHAHATEQLDLLKTLAAIPAPSHQEDKRAEYIYSWLKARGAENIRIDRAKNVVLSFCADSEQQIRIFMAHTDTVFPDMEPMPVREENGCLYAPGVGDDTANVVALMLCAEYFLRKKHSFPMVFVFNSCEEGLGNLKGVRQIVSDYAGRIRELVSFDLGYDQIIGRAVGSERWQITVRTAGGHSFHDFGNANAIDHLAGLIRQLYSQSLPRTADSTTTFNVGTIRGGTSVNTIAQEARMTYEYRSDDADCLALMARQFQELVRRADCPEARFTVQPIGNRPCGENVPCDTQQRLIARCCSAIHSVTGRIVPVVSGSTDANIPLSLGIPAATFGLCLGGGVHTRQEYVEMDSLTTGLAIALGFLLESLA